MEKVKAQVRPDFLPSGKEFTYRDNKYIKISSNPINPLVNISLEEGLCAAVHVDSGEVHAFSKQMVEIEGFMEVFMRDTEENSPDRNQDIQEEQDDV